MRFLDNNLINTFAHPWVLLALPLPLLLLVWHLYRARHGPSILFGDLKIAHGIPVSMKQRIQKLFPWIRAIALCLGIVALARPQYGVVDRTVRQMGVDISMVIDVSGSMAAQDYHPDRITVAKEAAIDFVRNREADRVHVILFAVDAFLFTPPTLDMGTVEQFLESIYLGIIPSNGTAIGDALAIAVRELDKSDAESRVVVLMTDGENNSGRVQPLEAAEIARALGIPVYTIGVGRNPGPQRSFGGIGLGARGLGFDETELMRMAEMTGGRYYRVTDEDGLRRVYQEVDEMVKSEVQVEETTDYDERFMLFWFPGLALIGLEFFLRAFWLRRLP